VGGCEEDGEEEEEEGSEEGEVHDVVLWTW
jgi:hypothetical protein